MFAHYQRFADLKLLEHDATFTRYAARPPFYAIRIVYTQNSGFENYSVPSELHLTIKPTNNPEVCMTVVHWTADSFDRCLSSIRANENGGSVEALNCRRGQLISKMQHHSRMLSARAARMQVSSLAAKVRTFGWAKIVWWSPGTS